MSAPETITAADLPAKRRGRAKPVTLTTVNGYLAALHLPPMVPEYRFHTARAWRLDGAWPDLLVGLEIEGGAFVGGRHGRGAGLEADCEKYAEAACAGWLVLRVTPRQVRSGRAARWLLALFCQRKGTTPT